MPCDRVEERRWSLVDDVVVTHEVGHRVGDELEGVLRVDALAGLVVDDPERAVGEAHEGIAGAGVAEGQVQDLELRRQDLGARRRHPGEVLAQAGRDLRGDLLGGLARAPPRRGPRCRGERPGRARRWPRPAARCGRA